MQKTILPPYAIHPQFLTAQDAAALLDHVLSIEGEFKPSTVGDHGLDLSRRFSFDTRNFGAFKALIEAQVRAQIPSFAAELGLPNLAESKLELHLVAYGDGSFQKAHIDTALHGGHAGAISRRITAIYYFHSLPKAFFGGELRLYSFFERGPNAGFIAIEPVHNQLVVFPAWVRHEVRPVHVPSGQFKDWRFAVNCWIHQTPRAST